MGRKTKDSISLSIRFPKEMHDYIQETAKKEVRSFNEQVIYYLLKSLNMEGCIMTPGPGEEGGDRKEAER